MRVPTAIAVSGVVAAGGWKLLAATVEPTAWSIPWVVGGMVVVVLIVAALVLLLVRPSAFGEWRSVRPHGTTVHRVRFGRRRRSPSTSNANVRDQ
jgi:hypothetical protein